MHQQLITVVAAATLTCSANAVDLFVPSDFVTIQDAIDAAVDGDVIYVEPGSYTTPIDIDGISISLKSSGGADVTTLEGLGTHRVIRCVGGAEALVCGFTIANGNANGSVSPENSGGGALIDGASLTFQLCSFEDNSADYIGGAVALLGNGTCTAQNCHFTGNHAHAIGPGGYGGGGVMNWDGSLYLTNCLFASNSTANNGAAIYDHGGTATLVNCTLADNDAVDRGSAIMQLAASSVTLVNTIVWDNVDVADQIWAEAGATTTASYCCVEGGFVGDGNIDGDPLFVGIGSEAYAIGSLASPVIDRGNTNEVGCVFVDLAHHPRVVDTVLVADAGAESMGVTVDIGAYEFDYAVHCRVDINVDGIVDVADLLILIGFWGMCD